MTTKENKNSWTMKQKLFLIMGVLSMFGFDSDAQKTTVSKKGDILELTSAKEDNRQRNILRYQPLYESELKALSTIDTLYLVDRKYVNYGTLDSTKNIPLTTGEKEIIREAYTKGVFDVMDYTLYDQDGGIQFISGTGIISHGEPAAPPPFYAYYFVIKNSIPIPYNYGIFGFYDTRYRVTISGEWREKVESIIKKYCPNSFSKSETYWESINR